MAEDNIKAVIEALLFACEKPLAIEQIRKVLDNMEGSVIRGVLEELKSEYEEHNRGMRIIEIAGGFQMVASSGFSPFLKKLFKDRNNEKLSKPALETLAIIAYKQPVTRNEIELLRNVNVDGVMNSLLDKNLVRIAGRKKVPGRPFVFGTTRQFLEYFGLNSLEELPKMEEFSKITEELNELEKPA
ncbi:MAG: SMC-Scp complex subunit ScpB [Candidatus Omnitrophica bacterium]|nr:SMC-Scp complex subunit ScpB [Candidatus Omnitrophota bacterium]MBL7151484.1 SMC-Scp complex subunit ScpB [Candidatus Omnitrophota bacterium]MBL7210243.1 SMC-Scp complex subunit ScpB [Candidatus Omnitrophota bacterium]